MRGYDYAKIQKYEKSQINGLTKKIAGLRYGSAGSGRDAAWERIFKFAESVGLKVGYCGPYYGERLDFVKPRKITKDQTDFGKQWLKEFFFKQDGTPRKGKRTENISHRVLSIAKGVSRFEFVGVAVLASSGWWPCQTVPIYRAYNRKGEYFDYSPIHWGQPIIDESN